MSQSEVSLPPGLYEELHAKFYVNGGCADSIFLGQGSQAELDDSRRSDIEDSFSLFREGVESMLANLGIENPQAVNRVTALVAFQERNGFESGVKFVHDHAHVTSRDEADRQRSVLSNMKTIGTR